MLRIKIGKSIQEEKDRVVESALGGFVDIKSQIDLLNVELKKHKDILIQKGRDILGDDEASTITFGVDDGNVNITFGWDIKVVDQDTLKAIVGDRFDDLVSTKVVCTPTAKLKEMVLEDDGLQRCMSVKEKAPALKIVK